MSSGVAASTSISGAASGTSSVGGCEEWPGRWEAGVGFECRGVGPGQRARVCSCAKVRRHPDWAYRQQEVCHSPTMLSTTRYLMVRTLPMAATRLCSILYCFCCCCCFCTRLTSSDRGRVTKVHSMLRNGGRWARRGQGSRMRTTIWPPSSQHGKMGQPELLHLQTNADEMIKILFGSIPGMIMHFVLLFCCSARNPGVAEKARTKTTQYHSNSHTSTRSRIHSPRLAAALQSDPPPANSPAKLQKAKQSLHNLSIHVQQLG